LFLGLASPVPVEDQLRRPADCGSALCRVEVHEQNVQGLAVVIRHRLFSVRASVEQQDQRVVQQAGQYGDGLSGVANLGTVD
jgi:hypothetical protein